MLSITLTLSDRHCSTTTKSLTKPLNLRQVEGLRKQLAKLDERARAKEQDLDDTLSKLEAFYKAYDSVMEDVQEVRMFQVLLHHCCSSLSIIFISSHRPPNKYAV